MRWSWFALVLLLTGSPVGAGTFVVRPDGSGDYPTIQAAIAAAGTGDVVELTDGTFSGDGNRDLDFLGKAIVVRSASGDPETCLLDCGGSVTEPHRGFRFHLGEPPDAEVTGISITGGCIADEPYGGAILCEAAASPTVRGCVFYGNQDGALVCLTDTAPTVLDCCFRQNCGYRYGAIYCDFATITITRCRFVENGSHQIGGALYSYATNTTISECTFTGNSAAWSGALELIAGNAYTVRDCLFEGNSANEYGAVHVFMSIATIERCTFARNSATGFGGALGTGKSSHTRIANCTFWGNGSPSGTLLLSDGGTTMENCIIAANPEGPSMCVDGDADLSCCDIWGNAGGDWVPGIAGQYGIRGNICEDPQFCDPENGDFTLSESSPCAPFSPPNPECDLIGAWPVDCAGTPVVPASWGGIKALFRP